MYMENMTHVQKNPSKVYFGSGGAIVLNLLNEYVLHYSYKSSSYHG